jgi:hypothetical protein
MDKNIYKKLAEVSENDIKVEKDAKNPFFKSNYTTLNEVLSKIKGALLEKGLLIIQNPQKEGLETTIIDTETSEQISSFVPYVGVVDMQKLGGAITYARRYALISMLGLESEDDDGNLATGKKINKNNDEEVF